MATFAEQMLAKYETLLQTSAGLDTVSVDGQPAVGPVPGEKGERPQAASINSPSRVARGDLGGF